jgi:penicillin-binding protein 2
MVGKRPNKKIVTRPITGKARKKAASTSSSVATASPKTMGLDRLRVRLLVFGLILMTVFVALFSRLWFLQVLAADEYNTLARENRVRRLDSEPPRGRILDRNGVVIVDNRPSRSITIDRQIVTEEEMPRLLKRLSRLLDVKVRDFEAALEDGTVSPYKPVPVVSDVSERQATEMLTYQELYPGVGIEELPVRKYSQGKLLAQVLGYVGEISPEELEDSEQFSSGYKAGDLIGKAGIERTYDAFLRGEPRIEQVVVDANNQVVGERLQQQQQAGNDLYLSVDLRVQKVVERALRNGIMAARDAGYDAPDGGAVILDPDTGDVIAMASYPTYNPSLLADGFSLKDQKILSGDPDTTQDDALTNRAMASEQAPGSTFKPITAGAALANDIIGPYDGLDCPGSRTYPPEGGPGSVQFFNWNPADSGFTDVPRSLEISCNTFYYELGWQMESRWGEAFENSDGTERFQRYERRAGFGAPTGIDLPFEGDGVVPDQAWCTANEDIGYCPDGWLPGYTVNMAIGQGDLKVTPLQMATSYAALVNGGAVWEPRMGYEVRKPPVQDRDDFEESEAADGEDDEGSSGPEIERVDPEDSKIVKDIKSRKGSSLPLDAIEMGVLRQGLEDVVMGAEGTAAGVFAGFPLEQFPIAGKTGTAQRGDTGVNDSWFVSYGPADDPGYVIAVYVEEAGGGGATSAPIARQIWEGIAALEGIQGIGGDTDVSIATDESG